MEMNDQYFLLKALSNWQPLHIHSPSPQAPTDSLSCLSQVLALAPSVTVISFDVFDTLLRRDVEPPQAVTRLLADELHYLLAQQGYSLSQQELLKLREQAENQARQQGLEQGLDAECRLSQISAGWLQRIAECAPAATLPSSTDWSQREVELECQRLSPMPGALDTLQQLKAQGKTLLAISDMYLEQAQLEYLLEHHGLLSLLDRVIVSSAQGLSKGSGRLFSQLQQAGVLPPNSLHIGDHPIADVQRPQALGIAAKLLFIPDEVKRRRQLELAQRAWQHYGDASHLWPNQHQPEQAIARIGYQRLGPIFTLFAAELVDYSLKQGINKLHFLARDGYLLKQLFGRLFHGLAISRHLPAPQCRYLYLSRASSRFAALTNYREELASLAQRVNRQQGVWALLATLGLDADSYRQEIDTLLAQHNLASDPTCTSLEKSSEQMKCLLNSSSLMARISQDLQHKRQCLADYLQQEGLFSHSQDTQLLVDIGWNGSILSTLEQAFAERPDFPPLHAYYFGRLYGSEVKHIKLLPGYAFDERRPQPIEQLINQCRELFEVATSSLEGSVLDYQRQTDGRVQPILAPCSLSEHEQQAILALQQGILAWCDDFVLFSNRFGFRPQALRPQALLEATRLLSGQQPQELEQLAALQFDLSWGSGSRVSLKEYLGIGSQPANQLPASRPQPLQLDNSQGAQPSQANPQKLFEKIHLFVEALKLEGPLAFYGVGTSASLLAPLVHEQIRYFVDGNASLHGQQFLGKPIQPPEAAIADNDITLVITPIGRKEVLSKRIAGRQGKTLYLDDFL
ncbi:HAD family hydrolase [Balneatrix alpica]|uniref:HAD family hydrolase n=1 Tax=Balneatrix alpica TaxID=75684 RepID=A0ABV5ZEA3_9GAMM|nr:HAD family hydrolase [Balneatrix alpica]